MLQAAIRPRHASLVRLKQSYAFQRMETSNKFSKTKDYSNEWKHIINVLKKTIKKKDFFLLSSKADSCSLIILNQGIY